MAHTLLKYEMNIHVCMHSLFYFELVTTQNITELEAVGGYLIMMNEFKREGGGGWVVA